MLSHRAVQGAGRGASLASLVAAAADENEELDALRMVTLHVREAQPLTLSVEQLGRMTWPELVAIWKEYINAIAMCLVTAGREDAGSPGMQRLQARADCSPPLCSQVSLRRTHTLRLRPQALRIWMCQLSVGPASPPDAL